MTTLQCSSMQNYKPVAPEPVSYSAVYLPEDYTCPDPAKFRRILGITILVEPGTPDQGFSTTITIGGGYKLFFNKGTLITPDAGVSYALSKSSDPPCPNSPPLLSGFNKVRATIIDILPGLGGASIGDVYEINTNYCNNNVFASTVKFTGQKQFTVSSTNNTSCIGCQCLKTEGKFQVPQIQITAQSTLEGTDIGESIFIICDKYEYYNNCEIPHNTCKTRFIDNDKVKQTKFNKCCPYMVSVVRGKGENLLEKVTYLYNKYRINIPFNEFYGNIILYGMTRYVLAKLLWGKFNIDYLLNKYTKEFFHDLKHSRFCNFIEFFETSVKGYEKYFKCEN